jgi:hypothetical protein
MFTLAVALILSLACHGYGETSNWVYAQDVEVNPDTHPATDADPAATNEAAIPAPDFSTPPTQRPVLFIHGLDAVDFWKENAAVDCLSSWKPMRDKL